MNNIITELKNRKIRVSLHLHDDKDLANGWEIKAIIDNSDLFLDISNLYPLMSIEQTCDLYEYFLLLKISQMSNLIPAIVSEEHKTVFSKIVNEAKKTTDNIDIGHVIKYVNKNYESIFNDEKEMIELKEASINFLTKYVNGISKNVIEYLCDNQKCLLIDRFSHFEKIFENDKELAEKMFPTGELCKIDPYRLDETLRIWTHELNKNKSFLKDVVEKNIPKLYEDICNLSATITIDNVIREEATIRKFYEFLRKIKSPLANDFKKIAKNVEELLSQNIQTKGKKFTYEIPVEKILEEIKTQTSWLTKLTIITHEVKKKGSKLEIISRLSFKKDSDSVIMDLVSTNVATDDYYTLSHQQNLSIVSSIGIATISGILYHNMLDELTEWLKLSLHSIDKQLNSFDSNFDEDIKLLHESLENMVKSNDESIIRYTCYGASMFICALIEKILRGLYFYLASDKQYIPVEKATLGELFNENNEEMVSVFGIEHIKNISFFLQRNGINGIGYNYRNRLAHWTNIQYKELSPSLVSFLLWILVDVINTAYWHFEVQ